jgi:hypothetical protein
MAQSEFVDKYENTHILRQYHNCTIKGGLSIYPMNIEQTKVEINSDIKTIFPSNDTLIIGLFDCNLKLMVGFGMVSPYDFILESAKIGCPIVTSFAYDRSMLVKIAQTWHMNIDVYDYKNLNKPFDTILNNINTVSQKCVLFFNHCEQSFLTCDELKDEHYKLIKSTYSAIMEDLSSLLDGPSALDSHIACMRSYPKTMSEDKEAHEDSLKVARDYIAITTKLSKHQESLLDTKMSRLLDMKDSRKNSYDPPKSTNTFTDYLRKCAILTLLFAIIWIYVRICL